MGRPFQIADRVLYVSSALTPIVLFADAPALRAMFAFELVTTLMPRGFFLADGSMRRPRSVSAVFALLCLLVDAGIGLNVMRSDHAQLDVLAIAILGLAIHWLSVRLG
jgi:hypothetical protein